MAPRPWPRGALLAALILSAAVLIAPAAAKRRHGNKDSKDELDCGRMPGCLACKPRPGAAGAPADPSSPLWPRPSRPADGPSTGAGWTRPATGPSTGPGGAAGGLPARGGPVGSGVVRVTPAPTGRGASTTRPPAADDDEEPLYPEDSEAAPSTPTTPAAGGRLGGRGAGSSSTATPSPVTAPAPGRNLLGAAQAGPAGRRGSGPSATTTTTSDDEEDPSEDASDAAAATEDASATPTATPASGASRLGRAGRSPAPTGSGLTPPSARAGTGGLGLGTGAGLGLGSGAPATKPPRRRNGKPGANDAADSDDQALVEDATGASSRPGGGMWIIVRPARPGDAGSPLFPRPGGAGGGAWPAPGTGGGAFGAGRPFNPYPIGAGSVGMQRPGGGYGGGYGGGAAAGGGWQPYVGNRPRNGRAPFTCTECKSPKYDLTEDGVCVCAPGYGNVIAGQRQGSLFPLLPPPPCQKCEDGYVSAGGLAAATSASGAGGFGYGPRSNNRRPVLVECKRCEQGTRPNKARTNCI